MRTRDDILRELRSISPHLKHTYGIEIVGLFGSWARGDSNPDSDIDVAYNIESGCGRTLLDIGGAYMDLREQFKSEIDLVDWSHVEPRYKRLMELDLVRING